MGRAILGVTRAAFVLLTFVLNDVSSDFVIDDFTILGFHIKCCLVEFSFLRCFQFGALGAGFAEDRTVDVIVLESALPIH